MFEQLEKTLGYRFSDRKLLEEALTHPSVPPRKGEKRLSYERLELLGDAVLVCAVVRHLFETHRGETEGELSRRKALLVSNSVLARVAGDLGLGDHMLLGNGEELGGGRKNANNLENVLEALLGAIFVDSNFETVQNLIVRIWSVLDRETGDVPTDPRTELQEWTQRHFRRLPEYELLSSLPGEFHLRLSVPGREPLEGSGGSIKMVKRKLAEQMLENIRARS
ncbi:MAG: ribonuclease III [Rickettsiales bacterium]|nr:ribonuclease III [Rickettsiales bacterium]